jgi:hypothetical protein
VTTYNKGYSLSLSFKDYCTDKGISNSNLIYLNKVKYSKKMNVSNYLCNIASIENFANLKKIVEKIKEIIS